MMNANEVFNAADVAIMAARKFGVRFKVKDTGLILEARKAPPPAIMAALAAQRANIMASLKATPSRPAAEDWLLYYRKRVVAEEVLEGLSFEQASVKAFE